MKDIFREWQESRQIKGVIGDSIRKRIWKLKDFKDIRTFSNIHRREYSEPLYIREISFHSCEHFLVQSYFIYLTKKSPGLKIFHTISVNNINYLPFIELFKYS